MWAEQSLGKMEGPVLLIVMCLGWAGKVWWAFIYYIGGKSMDPQLRQVRVKSQPRPLPRRLTSNTLFDCPKCQFSCAQNKGATVPEKLV